MGIIKWTYLSNSGISTNSTYIIPGIVLPDLEGNAELHFTLNVIVLYPGSSPGFFCRRGAWVQGY